MIDAGDEKEEEDSEHRYYLLFQNRNLDYAVTEETSQQVRDFVSNFKKVVNGISNEEEGDRWVEVTREVFVCLTNVPDPLRRLDLLKQGRIVVTRSPQDENENSLGQCQPLLRHPDVIVSDLPGLGESPFLDGKCMEAAREADCLVIVFDSNALHKLLRNKSYSHFLKSQALLGKSIVVVINVFDDGDSRETIATKKVEIQKYFGIQDFGELASDKNLLFVNAKSGEGLGVLCDKLWTLCLGRIHRKCVSSLDSVINAIEYALLFINRGCTVLQAAEEARLVVGIGEREKTSADILKRLEEQHRSCRTHLKDIVTEFVKRVEGRINDLCSGKVDRIEPKTAFAIDRSRFRDELAEEVIETIQGDVMAQTLDSVASEVYGMQLILGHALDLELKNSLKLRDMALRATMSPSLIRISDETKLILSETNFSIFRNESFGSNVVLLLPLVVVPILAGFHLLIVASAIFALFSVVFLGGVLQSMIDLVRSEDSYRRHVGRCLYRESKQILNDSVLAEALQQIGNMFQETQAVIRSFLEVDKSLVSLSRTSSPEAVYSLVADKHTLMNGYNMVYQLIQELPFTHSRTLNFRGRDRVNQKRCASCSNEFEACTHLCLDCIRLVGELGCPLCDRSTNLGAVVVFKRRLQGFVDSGRDEVERKRRSEVLPWMAERHVKNYVKRLLRNPQFSSWLKAALSDIQNIVLDQDEHSLDGKKEWEVSYELESKGLLLYDALASTLCNMFAVYSYRDIHSKIFDLLDGNFLLSFANGLLWNEVYLRESREEEALVWEKYGNDSMLKVLRDLASELGSQVTISRVWHDIQKYISLLEESAQEEEFGSDELTPLLVYSITNAPTNDVAIRTCRLPKLLYASCTIILHTLEDSFGMAAYTCTTWKEISRFVMSPKIRSEQ